jgi:chemotaxis protein methyltransferase CheR
LLRLPKTCSLSLQSGQQARSRDGQVVVAYEISGTDWKLSVSDNGIGKPDGVFAQSKTGLGTGIVTVLSSQLDAKVETLAGPEGTTVSVTHATFSKKALMPARAARPLDPEVAAGSPRVRPH